MVEQKIQAKILGFLKSMGCYTVKVMAANRNGVPDILGCYKGHFIAVEVKRPGNKPTELQQAHIDGINQKQGYAIVAYSVDEVETMLKEIDNETLLTPDHSS